MVYNDFYIGEDSDVVIVAGCGIHNCGDQDSEHDGIHRFFIGKNAKVKYVEKHYGEGDGTGKRVLNPGTEVYMEENSQMEMEMVQIKGVDSTIRTNTAKLAAGARLVVRERLLTHGAQVAESLYEGELNGPLLREPPNRLSVPALQEMQSAAVIQNVTPLSWTMQRSWQFRDWKQTT